MNIGKRWRLFPQHPDLSTQIATELSILPPMGQILLNRNIRSLSDAKSFIHGYGSLSSHFPLHTLEKAALLIEQCIDRGESILVYGDYDVDGMTSTSMMVTFLRRMGAKVKYFLPHRFHQGYGLHLCVVDMILNEPFSLLITLDCGVTNVEEIAVIKEKTNASILVIDHHTLPDTLPAFDAMINPKELESTHFCYHLCTAGIVYLFGRFLEETGYSDINADEWVDVAALGTVADIATLKGVNRDITRNGLIQMSQRKHVGINALLTEADCTKSTLTPTEIGFVIAPRLNAAGRLDTALLGVQLLLAPTFDQASTVSKKLEKMNKDRREIDQSIFLESVKSVGDISKQKAIVLAGNGWHAGVIGITASKIVEKFNRPAVIIAYDDQIGRGSARSIGNVNIYAVLKECKEFFIDFGGHKEAAGFSIHPDRIDAFKRAFNQKANELIKDDDLRAIMSVDMKLSPHDMTLELAESLQLLQPFGQGNPTPLFYTDELRIVDCRTVGDGSHVKATFTDKSGGVIIDGIGFGLGDKMPLFQKENIAVAFHLTINEWNQVKRPQLQIVDIK